MFLEARVKERLVLYDRATERPAELVADQVVLHTANVGKPILRGQCLNAVVLEQRTVPLVGAALQHCVGHKPAHLAIFGTEIVSDHSILFDRIGRDRGVRTALAAGRATDGNATLPLLVVVNTFDHVVAATGPDTID